MYISLTWKGQISQLCAFSGVITSSGGQKKNQSHNIEISLSEAQTLYGITDTVPQCLGLNLCLIIAKYYIYTASKNEEDYFFDAFLSILKNKIQIETSKAKVQVKL